jgi:type IV secretory pathway protease TraF
VKLERFALILTSTALLALAGLRWYGITGNVTDSEPRGIYLALPGTAARGDMVALRSLMKHVAGVAGDTVRVTPQGSYINGKLWPDSAPVADSGYKPYAFGTYVLAPGQFWLLGTSSISWDSRYQGPIPGDLINTRIKPLDVTR